MSLASPKRGVRTEPNNESFRMWFPHAESYKWLACAVSRRAAPYLKLSHYWWFNQYRLIIRGHQPVTLITKSRQRCIWIKWNPFVTSDNFSQPLPVPQESGRKDPCEDRAKFQDAEHAERERRATVIQAGCHIFLPPVCRVVYERSRLLCISEAESLKIDNTGGHFRFREGFASFSAQAARIGKRPNQSMGVGQNFHRPSIHVSASSSDSGFHRPSQPGGTSGSSGGHAKRKSGNARFDKVGHWFAMAGNCHGLSRFDKFEQPG